MDSAAIQSVGKCLITFSDRKPAFSFPGFSFKKGRIYQIKGGNGSGKSTLLNFLYKKKLLKNALFLDQNYRSLIYEYHKVWWNIGLPKIINSRNSIDIYQDTKTIMHELGIEIDPDRFCWELSGGEMRIITLARFSLSDCEAILLDEPFANLDTKRIPQVWRLIEDFINKGKSVILTSHTDNKNMNEELQMSFDGVDNRLLHITELSR